MRYKRLFLGDENGENSYEDLRKAVKEYRVTMKEYFKAVSLWAPMPAPHLLQLLTTPYLTPSGLHWDLKTLSDVSIRILDWNSIFMVSGQAIDAFTEKDHEKSQKFLQEVC